MPPATTPTTRTTYSEEMVRVVCCVMCFLFCLFCCFVCDFLDSQSHTGILLLLVCWFWCAALCVFELGMYVHLNQINNHLGIMYMWYESNIQPWWPSTPNNNKECWWMVLCCLVVRLFGYLVVWLFGCLIVWLFGCLTVWWFGGLVVWLMRFHSTHSSLTNLHPSSLVPYFHPTRTHHHCHHNSWMNCDWIDVGAVGVYYIIRHTSHTTMPVMCFGGLSEWGR